MLGFAWFYVGLVSGFALGILTAGMLVAAGREDED
ncbi:hypothetical protein Adeg_0708 [Ammonifex degensii KC4]|uniref:Uncharacterized protein n=1 Tax=Ammonifex degensii (strain DSM 10501 / KC4) TaxID=429009 RepID=C9RC78_AMMDK|nr:hypothetical protein Adeg_0708 [Ammonifex degensii KC4]